MKNFESFFANFIAYQEKYGTTCIPARFKSDDGQYLGLQVYRIRKGITKLSNEELQKLNNVGFLWEIQPRKRIPFDEIYNALKAFKAEYGHCNVKVNYVTPDGLHLGILLKNIKAGSRKTNDQQKAKLINLGFEFSKKTHEKTHAKVFETFYNELTKYKEEYGDCLVQAKYISPNGYRLGTSVMNVRACRKNLSYDEQKKLENLGFVWRIRERKQSFETLYYHLEKFVQENGHCNIPIAYVTSEGVKVGRYVAYLRHGDYKLTDEQKEKLERIGFKWHAVDRRQINFAEIYLLLVNYKKEFGNCLVEPDYVTTDGVKLGEIVKKIKTGEYKFKSYQRKKFRELGLHTDFERIKFKEVYNYLKIFAEQNGHCIVPINYVTPDGVKLGLKVKYLRRVRNKLSMEEQKSLENIGFVWWAMGKQKYLSKVNLIRSNLL